MSASSSAWCQRQAKDPFVKQARQSGWRSRAAFKLIELNDKDKLFKPGMNILDLGAAPGGWSQVLGKLLSGKGKVWALDILPMAPVPDVEFIQGDFTQESAYLELKSALGKQQLDWVVSDMAPNLTGIKVTDQAKSMLLVELAFDFSKEFLKPGGGFLAKVFHGAGLEEFVKTLRGNFKEVSFKKPEASRAKSREVYVLARGWRKNQ